ncbi:hypothetical protein Poly30_09780 [Planctomycetes bacterium Poly30]|uniref:Uncharacterized protein n=1 Tax=Saltatorellus ferox TaxID=2528018 RepID=A0A518EN16_9BACT|nr:hypothetical protein Poly30_09780 [Planctomycetes bacterium Poly30]
MTETLPGLPSRGDPANLCTRHFDLARTDERPPVDLARAIVVTLGAT